MSRKNVILTWHCTSTKTLRMSDVLNATCIFPNTILCSGLGIYIRSDGSAVLAHTCERLDEWGWVVSDGRGRMGWLTEQEQRRRRFAVHCKTAKSSGRHGVINRSPYIEPEATWLVRVSARYSNHGWFIPGPVRCRGSTPEFCHTWCQLCD